jgi:hypothetical protein
MVVFLPLKKTTKHCNRWGYSARTQEIPTLRQHGPVDQQGKEKKRPRKLQKKDKDASHYQKQQRIVSHLQKEHESK